MDPGKSRSLQHIKTTGRIVISRFGDAASHREQWQMIFFVVTTCSLLYWGDHLVNSWTNSPVAEGVTAALRFAVPLIVYSLIVLTIGLVLSWRRMSEMGEIKIISMDETGFVIGNRRFESADTQKIPWYNVEAVEVIRESGDKESGTNAGSVIYFTTRDVRVFKIRWENAFAWVDAESFFLHLKTQTPQPEIYFNASEETIAQDDARYTNLWLQYFSSPGTRERKGVLQGGTLLNDRYHILHKMGGGGQGTVYLASVRTSEIPEGFGETRMERVTGYSSFAAGYDGEQPGYVGYTPSSNQEHNRSEFINTAKLDPEPIPAVHKNTEVGAYSTSFDDELAAFNAEYKKTHPGASTSEPASNATLPNQPGAGSTTPDFHAELAAFNAEYEKSHQAKPEIVEDRSADRFIIGETRTTSEGTYAPVYRDSTPSHLPHYGRSENDDEVLIVLKEYILPVHRGVMLEEKHYGLLNSEAEILGRIHHPNIVRMLDCFVEDHRGYLVLEYVDGDSLRDLVQKHGPLSEAQVKEIAITICDILTYLHNFRPPIVHRDLTPDNLLQQKNGAVKLIDFTVAHQLESQRTATVVGKQAYIPPEQFRGAPGPESDVYALGCTMHFLLTGQDPEPMQTSRPADIAPGISARMNEIVATATAFDTKDRFQFASQLKAALQDA